MDLAQGFERLRAKTPRCLQHPNAGKASNALNCKCTVVREIAARFREVSPRVFGSVLHGTDQDGNDLDLLVDTLPGTTLFDFGDL